MFRKKKFVGESPSSVLSIALNEFIRVRVCFYCSLLFKWLLIYRSEGYLNVLPKLKIFFDLYLLNFR